MAGLRTGDEIIKWDNEVVPSLQQLYALIEGGKGKSHQLEIKRNNETRTLVLPPIGEAAADDAGTALGALPDKRFAVTAEELKSVQGARDATVAQVKMKLDAIQARGGIGFYEGVVAEVKDGTPAQRWGSKKET